MNRAPTALRSIGAFGIAVAVISVVSTAAVVVLAPEPAQQRMTTAEAIAALRGEETALVRDVGPAPEGARARLIESLITSELDRTVDEVRVIWAEDIDESRTNPTFRVAGTMLREPTMAADRAPVVLLRAPDGDLSRITSERTASRFQEALVSVPFPSFSASVRLEDGRWMTVSQPRPLLSKWQRSVLIALAVSLLLLAPLAWVFARRLTRPFRALAGALEEGSGPVPQAGPRELREAAGAIAAMRTKLTDEAMERARILTAIAHDLRTPLTGLRLRTETVNEPQRSRMVHDIERMESMIGEVLGFARDAASPARPIEVRAFVTEIVGDLGDGARLVEICPGDEVTIAVPPPAFRRVVENLIRNAIDYAGAGTIAIERDNHRMVLAVSDRGPGIAESERERVLRPFERGESSRNRGTGGTGLGLSIVHDFAVRHRGAFKLRESAAGGVLAELSLPAE